MPWASKKCETKYDIYDRAIEIERQMLVNQAINRIGKHLGIDPWHDVKPKPKVTDKMVHAALDYWINRGQLGPSRDYFMRDALEAALAAMDDAS